MYIEFRDNCSSSSSSLIYLFSSSSSLLLVLVLLLLLHWHCYVTPFDENDFPFDKLVRPKPKVVKCAGCTKSKVKCQHIPPPKRRFQLEYGVRQVRAACFGGEETKNSATFDICIGGNQAGGTCYSVSQKCKAASDISDTLLTRSRSKWCLNREFSRWWGISNWNCKPSRRSFRSTQRGNKYLGWWNCDGHLRAENDELDSGLASTNNNLLRAFITGNALITCE